MPRPRAVASWSSGKDSAWALAQARGDYDFVGLLTTTSTVPPLPNQTTAAVERVSMHGVRRSLLDAQARALGLAQFVVELPWPCSNEDYQQRMQVAVEQVVRAGVEVVMFGDLFLADVREYRERMLAGTGLRPVFPLWGRDTRELAGEMIAGGVRARLSCVDLSALGVEFVGRQFDASLLADLPAGVDPCGERGEFHTFVTDAPGFARAITVDPGETVVRDGFAWVDLS